MSWVAGESVRNELSRVHEPEYDKWKEVEEVHGEVK